MWMAYWAIENTLRSSVTGFMRLEQGTGSINYLLPYMKLQNPNDKRDGTRELGNPTQLHDDTWMANWAIKNMCGRSVTGLMRVQ